MSTEEEQKKKFRLMTTAPVEKTVCRLAVPSIISMFISAIYNIADTVYVGRLSTQATGAVGIVFAYMAFVQAFGFFLGQGSANYISRALGARDTGNAEKMAAVGFFSALFIGIAAAAAGLLAGDPILRLLGATETILPEARSYFRFIALGTPFIMSSFVLNNQMRLQGNAKLGMIGISVGATLNMLLDPLLIFVFDMGVSGASLATCISQTVSFGILLRLSGCKDGIKLRISNFHPTLSDYIEIAAGGLPSFGRQGLASIAATWLNRSAGVYGDSAIAAFSIVSRVTMFAMSVLLGFGQGFQPVCGFNYGAKLYDRVKKALNFCYITAAVYCTAVAAAGFVFAPQIVSAFRADDAELIKIGTAALRMQCLSFPLSSLTVISNMFLQNTRRTLTATLLSLGRQGLFFFPAIIIGTRFFGLRGLECTQSAADLCTFILAVIIYFIVIKKGFEKEAAEQDRINT